MKIAINIIATAGYKKYLKPLIQSAEKYFLPGIEKTYFLYTDLVAPFDLPGIKSHFIQIEHQPWPLVTLHRYHYISNYFLNEYPGYKNVFDYIFYVDADALFVYPAGTEILPLSGFGPGMIAVEHCQHVCGDSDKFPFERNYNSCAYIPTGTPATYYGGGFVGGDIGTFISAASWMAMCIDTDKKSGIIPVFHDESILNKYLHINPPAVKLSPSYHWPEFAGADGNLNPYIAGLWQKRGLHFDPKIMMLDKARGVSSRVDKLRTA